MVSVTLAQQQEAASLLKGRTECAELLGRFTKIFGSAVQHPQAAASDRRAPLRLAEVGLGGDLGDDVGGLIDGADCKQRFEQIALVPQVAGVEDVGMEAVDAPKMISSFGVATGRQRDVTESR